MNQMKALLHRGLFLIILTILLFGCGSTTDFDIAPRPKKAYEEKEMARMAPAESLQEPKLDDSSSISDTWDESMATPVAAPEKPEERKRIYSGFCHLLVDNLEEQKKQIARIAEENGGYVESSYEQTVVIRIPADQFHSIFNMILGLGDVVHKSIETIDVTEYYRDQKTRLSIAEKTRKRLYSLLERTKDVEERLKILREIKRLTEEIERIKLTLELLKRQIALSRITVQLEPRLDQEYIDRGSIPFRWIAELDPLYPSLGELRGNVSYEPGDGFAVFKREKMYRAESAEGIRIRIGTTANQPKGDSVFWQKALIHHLGRYYKETKSLDWVQKEVDSSADAGSCMRSVLFTSKDRTAFYYLVGVIAMDKFLYVVEVFFPDKSALDKKFDAIMNSLDELKAK